eukprot:gene16563-biopygen15829
MRTGNGNTDDGQDGNDNRDGSPTATPPQAVLHKWDEALGAAVALLGVSVTAVGARLGVSVAFVGVAVQSCTQTVSCLRFQTVSCLRSNAALLGSQDKPVPHPRHARAVQANNCQKPAPRPHAGLNKSHA